MAGRRTGSGALDSPTLVKPRTRQLRPISVATSNEVSDEELMERFCGGDNQAFDVLFERHCRAVHTYLARLVRSSAAAEDLTQATFLSVVRSRGRFRSTTGFRPWLYAIATNAGRDYFRRTRRETLSERGELPSEAATALDDGAPDFGLEHTVRAALERIPAQQREVIILNRFEGLSMAEVAVVVGASVAAVKVRAHRGYERLRQLLSQVWKENA
jgi:RNA polymerase sigma-70 factor (ECF subfamily)